MCQVDRKTKKSNCVLKNRKERTGASCVNFLCFHVTHKMCNGTSVMRFDHRKQIFKLYLCFYHSI